VVQRGHDKSRVYIFFCGEGKEKHQLGTEYFVHHKIVLAIKKIDFVSDTISYIVMSRGWCNIIVLNVHITSKEKSDDLKAVFTKN
jgi:hypothetical protein